MVTNVSEKDKTLQRLSHGASGLRLKVGGLHTLSCCSMTWAHTVP